MKILFVSFFLLMSSPDVAMIKFVELDSYEECLEAKQIIFEKFEDAEFRANNAPTKYKGHNVVYMTSECIKILPLDEF
jgi:hypothetical protein